jgi:2-polyprenyl-3-methyl-5-hydroxy-6-metoxy-1,4-benzoquinol methylase
MRRDSATRAQQEFEDFYRGKDDPWGYSASADDRQRHRTALELLDSVIGKHRPEALEIGCAEGRFTAQLAARCRSLLAVDISEIAIARARQRCSEFPHVSFARWNVRTDPPPGQFELVACMDVIDGFHRPLAQRRAADTVVASVAPGGKLLVSATVLDETVENAWWARWMGRGAGWIIRRFASYPHLTRVRFQKDDRYLIAVYRADAGG